MPKDIMCKYCNNLKNHWCETVIDSPDEEMQRDCQYFWQKTNGDRIRAMSDEELAKWLCGGAVASESACSYCENNKLGFCNGEDCRGKTDAEIIMEWLRQPAKEE